MSAPFLACSSPLPLLQIQLHNDSISLWHATISEKATINITHCSEKPPSEYVSSFRAKRSTLPLPCGPEQCLCILSASESIKQETGADCGCLVSCWIKALSTHWEWQGHISSRSQHAVMWADEHSCLLHIRRTQLEPCDLQWDCSSFCTCRSLLFSFVRFGSIHDNRWWFSIQIPLVTNCQALFTEYSP